MYSERFKKFMPLILEHEGGFVNDPVDPGGATKYGISIRFLKSVGDMNGDGWLDGDLDHDGDVDVNDIRMLTPETAMPFYHEHFYKRMRIDDFKSEDLAIQIFDFGVNAGTKKAIQIFQRLCGLDDDGVIGKNTLEKITSAVPCALPGMYMQSRIAFYERLVKANASLGKFLKGWKKRAQHCVLK